MKEETDEIVEYSRWEIDSCKVFFCFCVQKSHTVEAINFGMEFGKEYFKKIWIYYSMTALEP